MPDLISSLQKLILSQIQSNNIVVYIKGTKLLPLCGYSAGVLNILREYDVPFETVNVLENIALRQALKHYADWPTFPQVYVNGNFVGGLDIVMDMKRDGSLDKLLDPYKMPKVSIEL